MIRAFVFLVVAVLALAAWHRVPPDVPNVPLPPLTERIDLIEIDKSERRLTVYRDSIALRSYDIALGFSPQGHKAKEGDGRTPEGRYWIDRRNPQSAFHLSLGINYPRPLDRLKAAAKGVSPGGDIFIHGQPNGSDEVYRGDWTEGCIALSNQEMEELWRIAEVGTEVVIRP
ncbi:MAG: L,D-transpeptidase family protein [Pseudomonadota bacterium]